VAPILDAGDLFGLHGHVAGSEVHCFVDEVLNPGAVADRLIVDLDVLMSGAINLKLF